MKGKISQYTFQYLSFFVLVSIILSSLFFASSFLFSQAKTTVVFLDVGQGDAILIRTAHGRTVLVDSGKNPSISEKVSLYLPFYDRKIDLLVATHPDIDHVGGMDALLDEFQIRAFLHSGLEAGDPLYRRIAQKIKKLGIPVYRAHAGEEIFLDRNVILEILSPYQGKHYDNPNDYSIVLKLTSGEHSVLLTGDASRSIESSLIKMYGDSLHSDILKLGHHGSKTSSSFSFLEKVHPTLAIISVGCSNRYGHPNQEVLRNLDILGIEEKSTCTDGDLIFTLSDNGWWE